VTPAARLVEEIRARCVADPEIRAALTYGSVPQGLDDAYSDAEFWIFPRDRSFAGRRWIPLAATYLLDNEFGATVAILPGGMRVEFHFQFDIGVVADWPARGIPVEKMVLVDRDGELAETLRRLPDEPRIEAAEEVCGRFVNWWLLGWNVLARGEFERAHDALAHTRRQLLWLARLHRGATQRWLTPSRLLERDLPAADLAALIQTSSTVDKLALRMAYEAAWNVGESWWRDLVAAPPEALFTEIRTLLDGSRAVSLRPAGLGWPSG
jgi:lincosamide nucleotidyltransferase